MNLKKMSRKTRARILRKYKIPLDDYELIKSYKTLNIKRKMFITYIINYMLLEEMEDILKKENFIK